MSSEMPRSVFLYLKYAKEAIPARMAAPNTDPITAPAITPVLLCPDTPLGVGVTDAVRVAVGVTTGAALLAVGDGEVAEVAPE